MSELSLKRTPGLKPRMANGACRTNYVEHNSKETDELDLLKTKMSDALDLSKTGPASYPLHAIDLLKPFASDSLQDAIANQMSNGQENTTDAVGAKVLFYQDEGSVTTRASNNNNDR